MGGAQFEKNFMGMEWNFKQLLSIVLLFNTVAFPICYFLLNDISIVDILWGLMFLIPTGTLLINRITVSGVESVTDLQKLTFGLVALWGLRLAIHIGRRHTGEDWRYTQIIRPRWRHKGELGKAISCYLYVFMMQGTFSMVVNGSAVFIMRTSVKEAGGEDRLTPLQMAGTIVAFLGLLIEISSDMELQSHREDPKKKGTTCKSGLWRYSRHPNYFGESVFWWGIAIMAYSLPGGIKTVYSAVFITFLVRYVSGVRMLEKYKQSHRPEFRIYMLETSAFVPWFYEDIKGPKRQQLLEKFTKEIEQEKLQRAQAKEKSAIPKKTKQQ